ncbi:uncharacterized protein LOC119829074 [Zerene cesonia]|uniref:uncharacterized protein LOC119829074 n=1 Tax=Zerene cesonia TaxID=33412 RepID=UPI0018E51401|nr:uncharacterized protein LOC119829074 [Zerene cesonia]
MDWNNTKVIEFIELLQNEPTIWDPHEKSRKNRTAVNDAWERIKNSFSLQCSIDELKKKRNSLMAAYRDHLKKLKDSYATCTSTEDVYQPTWFAFEAMHSFLWTVYEYNNIRNTEEHMTSKSERPLSIESDMGSGNESMQYERCNKRKKTTNTEDLSQMKKRIDEAVSLVEERNSQNQTDENDLFGQLVAQKLKKMDEDDRLMLTHDIHNLIFKYEMKARSRLRVGIQLSIDS